MKNTIDITDIIETIDFTSEESTSYLDRDTARIMTVSEEEMTAAEDNEPLDDFPKWEHENIIFAKKVMRHKGNDIVPLPTEDDLDEYILMEKFVTTLDDKRVSESLSNALNGNHPFRRFKEKLHDFDISGKWYKYRDYAYKEIVVDWCGENKIEYIDDLP